MSERIAYLGPPGTFSYLAARKLVGDEPTLEVELDALYVIDAVESGQVDGGVIALENSLEGEVTSNLDALVLERRECVFAAELILPVSFTLYRLPGDDAPLYGVMSHRIALAQNSRMIRERGLETRDTDSTVGACALLAEELESGWGALAPPNLTPDLRFGLEPTESDLADTEENHTRFVLLRKRSPKPSGHDLSAFAILPSRDEPGSLIRILQEFSLRHINLTAIVSRPLREQLGDYAFYLECEGHVSDPEVAAAVKGVLSFAPETRFLGSFPADPTRPRASGPSQVERVHAAYAEIASHIDQA